MRFILMPPKHKTQKVSKTFRVSTSGFRSPTTVAPRRGLRSTAFNNLPVVLNEVKDLSSEAEFMIQASRSHLPRKVYERSGVAEALPIVSATTSKRSMP
jgi:hypothetical protein